MHHWKDGVRRLTAAAAALTAALALIVWAASPASAGGPTSVLVVSPESQETASAYCSDKAYSELERLLGPVGKGTRERPSEAVSASARRFNVTWLVHDVTPWRVDRVFMAEAGQDAWIHTAERFNESPNGLWHRAEDPTHLYKVLYSLGVMGERTSAVPAPGIYPAPWETEQAGPGEDQAADATASETRAAPGRTTPAPTGGGLHPAWRREPSWPWYCARTRSGERPPCATAGTGTTTAPANSCWTYDRGGRRRPR